MKNSIPYKEEYFDLLKKSFMDGTSNPVDIRSHVPEEGVFLGELNNTGPETETVTLDQKRTYISYLFPLSGNVEMETSLDNEHLQLSDGSYLMTAYPFGEWSYTLRLGSASKVRILILSLSKLHMLFGNVSLNDKKSLNEALKSYRLKSYYTYKIDKPNIQVVIHQLFNPVINGPSRNIYLHGKILEFLSMYIESSTGEREMENECPYITDNLDWEKIRKAERIIVDQITDPPSIRELARQVGTNELKLKTGFKHLFGNTVYGYVNNHRMEKARVMLEYNELKIKEIAGKIGYSNPSHFIAAFKKKFGVTPKKYLQGL